MDLALGLIETKGLIGAIEAADAMAKAADVKIISKEKVTGALMIIKIMGETAAVKSSVDAGVAAAQRVGELVSAHVIPRPDDQIDALLFDNISGKKAVKKESTLKNQQTKQIKKVIKEENISQPTSKAESQKEIIREPEKVASQKLDEVNKTEKKSEPLIKTKSKVPPMEQLVVLNVHGLRRIARGVEDFPIKGREISKANRAKLLDYFKTLQ